MRESDPGRGLRDVSSFEEGGGTEGRAARVPGEGVEEAHL